MVNVWAAIRGDGKVLYEILEGKYNSETYVQLLLNRFQEMDMPNSFLMQDGAGLHTSDDAVDWINFLLGDKWIRLKSSRLEFPPNSMDLTPMDFSFWNYIKCRVSELNPETREKLIDSIHFVMTSVPPSVIINM